MTSRELWIGTYPVAGAGTPVGQGEGVWTVPFDDETGALGAARQVAVVPSPSFVAARGPWLYAVSEDEPGAVVALAPGGRHVLVVDLGTDQVRRYAWDGRTATPDGIAVTFPPGTGPRHLDFSPDGRFAYVTGELDRAVHVLAWDVETATGALVQSVPAVVDAVSGAAVPDEGARTPPGDDPVRHGDGVLPSHLVLDGDQVLLTVRGADVLTRWQVGPDGLLVDGSSHALGGHWPRHFAVVGTWLVVALEKSGELVVLSRDGAERTRLALPSPTCVLPRG